MLLKLKNIFGWLLEQVLISNFKRKIAKFLEFLPLYKANHLFEKICANHQIYFFENY
jgi:hypothetical protein